MHLIEYYQKVRNDSMTMVKPLAVEDYIPQPSFFASPPKWNLAHTSWFFEELLLSRYKRDYKTYHPKYGYLFNSYYNSLGQRILRHNRGNLSRPTVEEIFKYRNYVDKNMEALLSNGHLSKEKEELVVLGLNHEQQHQELFFTDLKYMFSTNPLFPSYTDLPYCEDSDSCDDDFVAVEEGLYEIGYKGDNFYYDNERQVHKVYLQSYQIRKSLVRNAEFIAFIEDDGYDRFEFWHDEALAWKDENQIKHPMYWIKENNKWHQYTLAGLREINPSHILAHITFYEAAAFAQWKKLRLPTEFEWEIASDKIQWGKRWEWTESAYLPYPGYRKAEGAVGEYNGKFMINQKVLRGASVVTPRNHSRKTYRNFFHPSVGYQFNGIRLSKNE